MSRAEGVDPDLLREALGVVDAGGAFAEPAVAAFFRLSQAIGLLRDGRTSEALTMLAELAGLGASVPPSAGLEAAVMLAEVAFGRERWDLVADAERMASVHLDALASRTVDLYSRDATSAQRGKLATLAAYAAARSGALDDALRILERGRTTMFAERFQAASSPAVRADVSATPEGTPGRGLGLGLSRDLGRDLGRGPVIQLVVTGAGGLALVCESGQATRPIWIADLGGADFSGRLHAYLTAMDGMRRNSIRGQSAWMAEVARMVGFLSTVLEPLVAAFPRESLTVVPVGILALLPVTAALLAGDGDDRAVSMLPSLGAAPTRAPDLATDAALVVTEPGLPAAQWETAGVRGFFASAHGPSHGPPHSPPGELTVASVLAAFPAGGVAHFGCHAEANTGAPLRSALILPGDVRLTVQDVLAGLPESGHGAVVVLSACESGLPGPNLLDEAIGLPIAFLAAGCGAVVSTLWLVEDLSTALVMLRFYWHWRHDNVRLPLALAKAMHWLRSTSDQAKCDFAEIELVSAGVLSPADGAGLAEAIRDRSDFLIGNSFSEPYFWAGFYYTGR